MAVVPGIGGEQWQLRGSMHNYTDTRCRPVSWFLGAGWGESKKEALALHSPFDTKHSTSRGSWRNRDVISHARPKHYLQSNPGSGSDCRRMETYVHAPLGLTQSRPHHFPGCVGFGQERASSIKFSNQLFHEKYVLSNLELYQPEMSKKILPSCQVWKLPGHIGRAQLGSGRNQVDERASHPEERSL